MSKLQTSNGLAQDALQLYPHGNNGCQRVKYPQIYRQYIKV